MAWFLGLGITGVVLLALSLVFDGVLEGAFGGALDGLLEGWLSLPVIAGFTAMTGFAGTIALGTGWTGPAGAAGAGAVAGVGAGWLTYRFSRALMRDRTAVTPRTDDLLGTSGKVVTAIPADGFGEVLLRLAGQPLKCAARSAEPVARGTEVWVEAVPTGTSVVVRPVDR
ncbi:NfeD family protein [Streptomyces rochei]|uniref:NfeD family protein n=2 Tax=Streptomyces rochei group TaxID=2867164 RepID=A0AAX3ZK47_STRRO|nr:MULTISPECIES: NfeD family protein [Streptomyces]MDV6288975.1 NfeD family protein [Streptomyces sp. UP1A-1]MBJ6620662.1 NfeD family protein [Streptomyces sp. DHE17-7]MBU8550970.1 NfeD family protein [Streptomyces sp. Osf17]MBU8557750.1 NfeD family protein [Streptomyces sp. Babs14]MBX4174652.1 NfeD family protein [Streptomyces geysiriensis]